MFYLKKLISENTGAIKETLFDFPFDDAGNPKPIVLVGENGTGKTVLTSSIADALLEFADDAFEILPRKGLGKKYYKILGSTNVKSGEKYGFTFLQFQDTESQRKFNFIEKAGEIKNDELKAKTNNELDLPLVEDDNQKLHTEDKKYFEKIFKEDSFVYFPANRFEHPHWRNESADVDAKLNIFDFSPEYSGTMRKEIISSTSLHKNRQWIFDVLLDSKISLRSNGTGGLAPRENVRYAQIFSKTLENVESIISKILKREAEFYLNYRVVRGSRLAIRDKTTKEIIVPSLENLSLGQAILLNLFITIIRHSDTYNLTKSINLADIGGIVIIDEVDLHLHSALQYEILPDLIKLFPKVQFIITTHSPLFLLGMKNVFGEEKFQIRELPDGKAITTERFSEFKKAFEVYKKTEEFENKLVSESIAQSLPVVFVEGETDEEFIKKAVEIFDITELMPNKVTIRWVGRLNSSGNAEFTGDTALNQTRSFYTANPDMIKCKTVLLYDFDSRQSNLDFQDVLFVRSVTQNTTNTKIAEGIENLFAEELFTSDFYDTSTKPKKYGGQTVVTDFNKRKFCTEMCTNKANRETFKNFEPLLNTLKSLI